MLLKVYSAAPRDSFEIISVLAIEVAIYRMGTWPSAKMWQKWERKWTMALRLKWPKNGR